MEPAEVEAFRRQAVRVLARRAQARAAMGEGAAAVEDYVEARKWVCSLPSCLHLQQNTKQMKTRKITFPSLLIFEFGPARIGKLLPYREYVFGPQSFGWAFLMTTDWLVNSNFGWI